jgi:hypothetical protein
MTTSVRSIVHRWRPLTFLVFALLACSPAAAFDREAFEKLDPAELRAAEDRMHEYLEPGSARLLREPRNAAEAYVVERQQRLARAIEQSMKNPSAARTAADGSWVSPGFWPAARATQLRVDADGRVRYHCVSVVERLGRQVPDFRRPTSERKVAR